MNNRSVLIGIDGLGGSGKTTYALNLKRELQNAIVIHLDDFIHTREVRYNDQFKEWYCYYYLQWRYDYLIEKLLEPVRNGLAVHDTIELYDKPTDSYRMQTFDIPVGTTVIVEGVFLQRPELRAYFDKVIYLETDRETRMIRALDRDGYIGSSEDIIRHYEQRYFPAEDIYVEQCNPLVLADVVENEVKG
ncbi:AAA family ATPase [Sporosarcina sp. YIM B06819]|uniref:AAA family ATPase n=1 Tax=Sporosarcina sp. YIM B06819 TaxID=3081769 RepID=UPI00298C3032|nr:AAA family ATPase [Sporosarcina sp. YIM B06819]